MKAEINWKRGQGPRNFSRTLTKLEGAMLINIRKAMGQAALIIERDAKRLAPVDTGTLRSSIGHLVQDLAGNLLKAVIGTNVEYGPYVEFGTYKMEAQPYLRPALENNLDEIAGLFEDALRDAVRVAS